MSTPNSYLYSFGQVSVLYAGINIGGFAEADDAVRIEFNDPLIDMVTGCDGQTVASQILNYSANITLTLLQTSVSNDLFSAEVIAYRGNVIIPKPIIIRNAGGSDLFTSAACFVGERPAAAYGKRQNNRQWVLKVPNLVSFQGGSRPL